MKKIFALYLVLLFVFGEVVVRYLILDNSTPIQYQVQNGFYTYPLLDKIEIDNEDGQRVVIETDELGLRNLNIKKANDMIILGDSFISAVNTDNSRTFVKNLGGYNAGMDGYSTFNSLRLLEFIMKKQYRPKQVLHSFYLGNDFRDNYFENTLNFTHTESKVKEEVFLKQKIIKILKSSKLITKTYHALRNFIDLISSEPSMRSYAVSEIYSYTTSPNDKFNMALDKTKGAFEILKNMSDKYGFEVIVVGIPSKAQVYKSFKEITHYENDNKARLVALDTIKNGFDFDRPDQVVNDLSNKFNFQYISLLNHFRNHSSEKIYYFIDSHWSYKGQELAADVVDEYLK